MSRLIDERQEAESPVEGGGSIVDRIDLDRMNSDRVRGATGTPEGVHQKDRAQSQSLGFTSYRQATEQRDGDRTDGEVVALALRDAGQPQRSGRDGVVPVNTLRARGPSHIRPAGSDFLVLPRVSRDEGVQHRVSTRESGPIVAPPNLFDDPSAGRGRAGFALSHGDAPRPGAPTEYARRSAPMPEPRREAPHSGRVARRATPGNALCLEH
jgi:hypothetical protein